MGGSNSLQLSNSPSRSSCSSEEKNYIQCQLLLCLPCLPLHHASDPRRAFPVRPAPQSGKEGGGVNLTLPKYGARQLKAGGSLIYLQPGKTSVRMQRALRLTILLRASRPVILSTLQTERLRIERFSVQARNMSEIKSVFTKNACPRKLHGK
jgi:hypothetical protein